MVESHEPQRSRLRMVEQQRLQTISMFARAVGLSPSALRQYGESGLIVPAAVEERTGYRYYGLDQQQHAIWIRRLRDAGLRLERIRSVFESDSADAEAVLDDWLAEAEERSASIEALVNDLRSSLRAHVVRNPLKRTSVSFDAAVLAFALRQLGPLTETSITTSGFDQVLVEVRSSSAEIIATDRYVLLARTKLPAIVDGPPARVHLSASAVATWVRERQQVELIVEVPVGRDEQQRQSHARLRDARGDEILLPQESDRFPDVRQIIDAIEPAHGRVHFARDEVRRLAAERDPQRILLTCEEHSGRLAAGDRAVSGQGIGTFSSLELSKSALLSVAEAAVGDELTCDVSEPGQPLVWRAPTQPDFIALMMPGLA